MLNMGSTHAYQIKTQLKLTSKLEQENHEFKLQALKQKRIEAELQQEISEIKAVKEEELSKARLEGEKIAEMTCERMWNSAKERGRVLGVAAMEMRYQKEERRSDLTYQTDSGSSLSPSTTVKTGAEGVQITSHMPNEVSSWYLVLETSTNRAI